MLQKKNCQFPNPNNNKKNTHHEKVKRINRL